MTYSVKEIFYTLQGEGAQMGRPAVFCRFTGCNLWSGREQHRDSAVCRFCDTDFIGTNGQGGGKFRTAEDLADALADQWPKDDERGKPLVVCTGGEPLLQLDTALIDALHARKFEIAIETNGTMRAPEGIDWICVSPKGSAPVIQTSGHELKLVYPQAEQEAQPECLERLDFTHFFLQPMDGPQLAENTRATVSYCLQHPNWRLSVQSHKVVGID